MDPAKGTRVVVRVRNHLILERLHEEGFRSVAQLCRRAGASYQTMIEIINGRISPIGRDTNSRRWRWRKCVAQIATALNTHPEDLFTREEIISRIGRYPRTLETRAMELELMCVGAVRDAHPDAIVERAELRTAIDVALSSLRPREEKVLRLYYGLGEHDKLYTLEEIGRIMGYTRERIRQIHCKALHRLRTPRSRPRRCLAEFAA